MSDQPQYTNQMAGWGQPTSPVNYGNMNPSPSFVPPIAGFQAPQIGAPTGYVPMSLNGGQQASWTPGVNTASATGLSTGGNVYGAGAGGANPGFMDKMLGWTGKDGTQHGGWGGMALDAASGLASIWMGSKQLSLAKKSLRENRRQFNLNYDAQRKNYNSRIEDRQNSRVASNGSGVYESTSSYMQKNQIPGGN